MIYTEEKFKQLYVRALNFVYNEKHTILMLDAEFEMPENACPLGNDEEAWITDGKFYWLNGYFAYPKKKNMLTANVIIKKKIDFKQFALLKQIR